MVIAPRQTGTITEGKPRLVATRTAAIDGPLNHRYCLGGQPWPVIRIIRSQKPLQPVSIFRKTA